VKVEAKIRYDNIDHALEGMNVGIFLNCIEHYKKADNLAKKRINELAWILKEN
jgi:hypothetical protein